MIPITDRQCVILELVSEGLLEKQVAAHLGISQQTVKWHLLHARRQLGARNTTHAVAIYQRQRRILRTETHRRGSPPYPSRPGLPHLIYG